MTLAQIAPARLDGLIVVDAPPSDTYKESALATGTVQIVEKLAKLGLESKTKKTAMAALEELFPDNRGLVLFLAQNIVY